MIDVAVAIDAEARNVTLTTVTGGAYDVGGRWVPGGPASTTIRAAIQPASGNQLQDLPEGLRTEARWLCWSRSVLNVDGQITHAGVVYRIMYVWPRADGGFYRAALSRVTT